MKQISFEEMKKIELDILIYVADFCNRHNLKYYLSYGTLIGAVRHKGFIPWDDDIDIVMPRADYNKLMDIFNNESNNTPYVALIPGKSNHSFLKIGDERTIKHEPEYLYDKVKGMIDIDIFPLDGVPENDSEYAKWYDKLNRIYSVYFYTKSNKKNYTTKFKLKFFIKRIMWGIFELKDYKLLNKAKKFHQKYPIETSNYVGVMESKWNSKKNKVKKEYYMDRIEVNFEGEKFYAPKGYHEILTNIYGDYMTLPPKEKQIREHSSQVFWVKDNTCI